MATAVQLELIVDEKGAVQGVRSLDSALKGTATSTGSLDATLQRLNAHLDQLGQRSANSRKVSDELKRTNKEAHETREGIHLVTEEFGIEMPKAFKKLVAESEVAKLAIGAVGGAITAIAGIQIGVMLFEQAYEGAKKLYEEFIDINKSVDEYIAKAGEAASQKLIDTASIETARDLLKSANDEIAELEYRRNHYVDKNLEGERMVTGMNPGYVPLRNFTPEDDKQEALAMADRDAAKTRIDELQTQQGIKEIENRNAYASSTARPWQQANVDEQNAIRLAQKHLEITQAHEKALHATTVAARERQDAEGSVPLEQRVQVHEIDPNAGKSDYQQEVEEGRLRAQASRIQLSRQQEQELMQLRHAALEAGLTGERLYHQQLVDAIEDLRAKGTASEAVVAAVKQRFHAEEMKRLADEREALRKMGDALTTQGLTGAPKISAESLSKMHDVLADTQHTGGYKAGMIFNAAAAEAIQLEALNRDYTRKVDDLADERAAHEVQGYGQIEAERERSLKKALADYETQYGKDTNAPAYRANLGTLNRQYAIINGTAADQTAERNERNAEETQQIEAEAHRSLLSAERQQTAAIDAEYKERVRQYQAQVDQNLIAEEDFNRRVIAAGEERDAKLVESARQAREKMAGDFARFFRNPIDAMKELGDKAAGEAAAALVQRLEKRGAAGRSEQSGPGGIYDRIAGAPRMGRNPSTPEGAAEAERRLESAGRTAAAPHTLTVSTAQISVGTATILASGSGAVNPSALAVTPGGSTSLMSMGGYSASDSTAAPNTSSDSSASAPSFSAGGSTTDMATEPRTLLGGSLAPATGNTNQTTLSGDTVQQGISLASKAKGLLGTGKSASTAAPSTGDLGDFQIPLEDDKQQLPLSGTTIGAKKGMLGGGGVMANAAGAAGGAMGLFGAYESNGGVGGALSGAMSGMQLGMSVAGPWGAAVGAAAGLALGVMGFGGRSKAEEYDKKTVRPRITADTQSYQNGEMNYLAAYSDMQSLDAEAKRTLHGMGGAAAGYYSTVQAEIKKAEGRLTGEERAGRSKYTEAPAQFAVGTDSVLRTGMAIIHDNERIMPSDQNERITRALEAGASSESIARGYRTIMEANSSPSGSGGGDRTLNMNVSAIDSRGVAQFFDSNKHTMRSALNSSYGENSGGADA